MFWHDVAGARRELDRRKGERLTDVWQVRIMRDYWQFTANDFDRLIGDVAARELPDDRHVALSLSFTLYVKADRPSAWRQRLKDAVAGQADLETALRNFLQPPP